MISGLGLLFDAKFLIFMIGRESIEIYIIIEFEAHMF